MSNKPRTLYISFLPIILLVLLIVGAGFFLIKDDINLSKLFNKEPTVRRLSGFPTVVNTDQIISKQRVVIKSQAELEQFLKSVDKTGNLALGEKINFDREYLIGVSSDTFNQTGNAIKVRKLYEDKMKKTLLVSVRQTSMGETCPKDPQTNVAVDIVAITKTTDAIDFEVIKEVNENCK
jgi:hypothetical protein